LIVVDDHPPAKPAPGGAATPPHRNPRPLALHYNWTSIAGIVLAIGGITSVLFFAFVGSLSEDKPTYPGVVLLPFFALILFGLLLLGVGILREATRRRRGRPPSIKPTISIDLVKLTRRRPIFFTVSSTVVATPWSGRRRRAVPVHGADRIQRILRRDVSASCTRNGSDTRNPRMPR
jgi:hypothetical protein